MSYVLILVQLNIHRLYVVRVFRGTEAKLEAHVCAPWSWHRHGHKVTPTSHKGLWLTREVVRDVNCPARKFKAIADRKQTGSISQTQAPSLDKAKQWQDVTRSFRGTELLQGCPYLHKCPRHCRQLKVLFSPLLVKVDNHRGGAGETERQRDWESQRQRGGENEVRKRKEERDHL